MPTLGGPIAFATQFVANLGYIERPFFSALLLIVTIAVCFVTSKKKVLSRKLISLLLLFFVIINIIPLGTTINKTFQEINYVVHEDKTLPNDQAERLNQALEIRFKDKNVNIIREPIGMDKTRVIATESIWIGLAHYRRFIKNTEFVQFVAKNTWYKLY